MPRMQQLRSISRNREGQEQIALARRLLHSFEDRIETFQYSLKKKEEKKKSCIENKKTIFQIISTKGYSPDELQEFSSIYSNTLKFQFLADKQVAGIFIFYSLVFGQLMSIKVMNKQNKIYLLCIQSRINRIK